MRTLPPFCEDSHTAMRSDLATFEAQSERRYQWDFGDEILEMGRCRKCKSDIAFGGDR